MRRYIACLLTLGASCTLSQHVSAQIQMPAPSQTYSQVSHNASKQEAEADVQLKKLSVPASQARSIATALSLRYRDIENVRISPDVRNQHLVVMAPESTQKKIAEDVQKFLSAGGVRQNGARMQGPLQMQLSQIGWHAFEKSLQKADGGVTPVTTSQNGRSATYQLTATLLTGTTVMVDRSNGTVTINGPNQLLPAWQKLIGILDQKPSSPNQVTHLMPLDGTEPAPIQRAFRLLKNLRPQNHASNKKPESVFRTAAFQQQADDAGTPPADGQPADDGGSGVIGGAQIQFVPELGQIIIRGTQKEIDRIKQVIQEIQEANELTQPEIEVLQLEHADCNAVATLLQQLYEDVLSARQGDVSITSLDSPNALLLIGRAEAINSLRDLVKKIDLPVTASSRLRVFRLQHASATDAQAVVQEFFELGAQDGARPGIGLRVRVSADFRTNSLIVNASPRDMEEVTRLINELDAQNTKATNELRIFSLNNASAETLATTLETAINEAPGGDDNVTPNSASLSIVSVDSEGQKIVDSGILSGALITSDTGANAIVVRAPSTSMPLIAELIRQLDRAPGIDSLVKVFTIVNGDATQLTTALTTLFGDEAATSGTTIGAANVAGLPPATASAESTLVPLRFSPDIRTNSIIASGSASDLEVVESILLRLDSEGFAERITEVIWLRHSLAESVAAALTSYVDERAQSRTNITQYQTGLGPFDLVDRDLIAVADIDSNSLLISVSPRLYEDVRRLIDRLDRRRPMVLIKTLMAEVRLDDVFEVGGELGLQDSLVFDRGSALAASPAGNPGFNFNNAGVTNLNSLHRETLAAGGMSAFGLGTASTVTGYGGFVLNAASESVSLLMRTLHEANRLQVLSRPQVMTMDGTESLVSVGSKVARITGVVINNNTSQTVTEDIDVGLIMRVTPRVGADGLITMAMDMTRSARDPNNGTIIVDGNGNPVRIDDILETTAQSTLTAYSGQTVVFGGLIQKERTNVSRRVPIMADIPLLGNLFKFDTEVERRSELLCVMTPMIVDDEQDLDYVKESESRRMSWCLADVVEAHGDVGLSGGYGLWGPAVGNTIYPDLQPTAENEVIISDEPISAHGNAVSSDAIPETVTYSNPTAPQALPVEASPAHTSGPYNGLNTAPVTVEEFGAGIQSLPAPVPSPVDGASMQRSGFQPASIQRAGGVSSKQNGATTPVAWLQSAKRPQRIAKPSDTVSAPSYAKQQRGRSGAPLYGEVESVVSQQTPDVEAAPASNKTRGFLPAISPQSWIR